MTVITIAQNTPVLVAIDIAKARHEVLIAVPGKKRRRRLTVLNELADFTRLIAALKDYGHPVRAAFSDSVGGCEVCLPEIYLRRCVYRSIPD